MLTVNGHCFFFTAEENYVSNAATSWENVSCMLVTPEIEYTASGISVKENLNVDVSVWIGYYSAYQNFQYYGMIDNVFISLCVLNIILIFVSGQSA